MHKILGFIGSQALTNLLLVALTVVLTTFTLRFLSLTEPSPTVFGPRSSIPVNVSGDVSVSGSGGRYGLAEPVQVEIQTDPINVEIQH